MPLDGNKKDTDMPERTSSVPSSIEAPEVTTGVTASVPGGATEPAAEPATRDRGVTPRVIVLSLFLAVLFGWIISITDYRFSNTFLGATHLPPGAVGAILLLLLVVNPLLWVLRLRHFSRNE